MSLETMPFFCTLKPKQMNLYNRRLIGTYAEWQQKKIWDVKLTLFLGCGFVSARIQADCRTNLEHTSKLEYSYFCLKYDSAQQQQ